MSNIWKGPGSLHLGKGKFVLPGGELPDGLPAKEVKGWKESGLVEEVKQEKPAAKVDKKAPEKKKESKK